MADISPLLPGAMGVSVHLASVHPQSVPTYEMTKGSLPRLAMEKVAVTGSFQRTVPRSASVRSKKGAGCAVATAARSENRAMKAIRFISFSLLN